MSFLLQIFRNTRKYIFLLNFSQKSNFECAPCLLIPNFSCLPVCPTLHFYFYLSRCRQPLVFSNFFLWVMKVTVHITSMQCFWQCVGFSLHILFRRIEIITLSIQFYPYSSCFQCLSSFSMSFNFFFNETFIIAIYHHSCRDILKVFRQISVFGTN